MRMSETVAKFQRECAFLANERDSMKKERDQALESVQEVKKEANAASEAARVAVEEKDRALDLLDQVKQQLNDAVEKARVADREKEEEASARQLAEEERDRALEEMNQTIELARIRLKERNDALELVEQLQDQLKNAGRESVNNHWTGYWAAIKDFLNALVITRGTNEISCQAAVNNFWIAGGWRRNPTSGCQLGGLQLTRIGKERSAMHRLNLRG